MRLFQKIALLTLVPVFVASCTDTPVEPDAEQNTRRDAEASAALLTGLDAQQLQRPVLDLEGWEDARTVLPIDLLVPEAARNIGPGSAIIITIPDEGSFGCTSNFVFEGRGRRYLGAAGHCFLPEDRTSTHGPGADYDARGVVVEVCVEDCEGNFQTSRLLGTWAVLGKVAYARQTSETGAAVGYDFGVVEIPRPLNDLVRTSLPVWGGPTGIAELRVGDTACHYGHGVGFGEVFPTKARVGIGGGSDDESWVGDFAGAFGDSGSALVACDAVAATFEGRGAIGVLTHLGVRVDPLTGEHGVVLGTTIEQALEMAGDAHLKLNLVLQ